MLGMSSFSGTMGRLYKDGETIYAPGEVAEGLFVVQEGVVEIVLPTQDGPKVINRVLEGEAFGEVSIFADRARFTTARASGKTRVLMVDRRTFVTQVHKDPSAAFRIIQEMARRIYELDHQMMQCVCGQRDFQGSDRFLRNPLFPDIEALLVAEVERSHRLNQELAFALVDVDGFTGIHRERGLTAAHAVMSRLLEILRGLLRKGDVVGWMGNDRLGLILYETNLASAKKVLKKARKAFAVEEFEGEKGERFSAAFSAGAAVKSSFSDAPSLGAAAHTALEDAKYQGGDRVKLAKPEKT